MIDWLLVIRHGLWISGLAIVLASWGYYHWLSTVTKEPRMLVFRRPAWIASSAAGLGLFALGQSLLSGRWYEHLGWVAIGVYGIVYAAQRWRLRE